MLITVETIDQFDALFNDTDSFSGKFGRYYRRQFDVEIQQWIRQRTRSVIKLRQIRNWLHNFEQEKQLHHKAELRKVFYAAWLLPTALTRLTQSIHTLEDCYCLMQSKIALVAEAGLHRLSALVPGIDHWPAGAAVYFTGNFPVGFKARASKLLKEKGFKIARTLEKAELLILGKNPAINFESWQDFTVGTMFHLTPVFLEKAGNLFLKAETAGELELANLHEMFKSSDAHMRNIGLSLAMKQGLPGSLLTQTAIVALTDVDVELRRKAGELLRRYQSPEKLMPIVGDMQAAERATDGYLNYKTWMRRLKMLLKTDWADKTEIANRFFNKFSILYAEDWPDLACHVSDHAVLLRLLPLRLLEDKYHALIIQGVKSSAWFFKSAFLNQLPEIDALSIHYLNPMLIPSVLQNLPYIRYVRLVNNYFCDFRANPSAWPKLERLAFENSNNSHITFPDWLYYRPNFQAIRLSGCEFDERIAHAISGFHQLRRLELLDFKQDWKPKAAFFENFKFLVDLSINIKYIEQYPDAFASLTSLKTLRIKTNAYNPIYSSINEINLNILKLFPQLKELRLLCYCTDSELNALRAQADAAGLAISISIEL
jgi:hypothetical protein